MFCLQTCRSLSVFNSDLLSVTGLKKYFAFKTGGGMPKLNLKNLNLGSKQAALPYDPDKVYDAVVIGGGTGSMSFVQEARDLGLSVAIFNYVDPTPKHNFSWGLGGTCVNVGCIPKKLFHNSGIVKETLHMAEDYGWDIKIENSKVNWEVLRNNVQNHIKSLNFGYVTRLKEVKADYIRAKARINKDNQVVFDLNGEEHTINAKNIIIATGGRPRYLPNRDGDNFKYEEECITSDDLFALEKNPGKTLVVGGGYIAIECAGFLKELGNDVIMINRSTFLRVFDQSIAAKIMESMKGKHLKALEKTNIKNITKQGENDYLVELSIDGKSKEAKVNTILLAIGRDPNTEFLRESGIELNPRSSKVQGREGEPERTNIDHIYAIGDVLEGMPELMPVAQKSGKLLAHRINQRMLGTLTEPQILEKYSMNYSYIPTTVFSNIEYSFVGISEEEADCEIEVYHREVTPLEVSIVKTNSSTAYMKIICTRDETEKVLGIHYLGPHAGEVINGFALAMKFGITKKDLDKTLGIHPTIGEDMFNLDVTKRSGKDYIKTDCCS